MYVCVCVYVLYFILPLSIRRDSGTTQFVYCNKNLFTYHICYENFTNYSKVKRQTEAKVLKLFSTKTEQNTCKKECIKSLNKVGAFTQGSKDRRKI